MGNGIDSVKRNTGRMYLVTPGAPFAATQENGITKDNVGKAPGLRGFTNTGKIYEEAFKGNIEALTIFLGGPMIHNEKYTKLYKEDDFKKDMEVSKKEFNEASFLKRAAIYWLGGK